MGLKKGIIIFASLVLALGIGVCGYKVFNMSREMARHRLDDEVISSAASVDDYEYIPDDDEEMTPVESIRVLRANSIANYIEMTVKIDAKDTYVVSYMLCKGKRFDPQRIISDVASYTYSDVITDESDETVERISYLLDSKNGERTSFEPGIYTLRVLFLNGKCCDCSFELTDDYPEMLKIKVGKEINSSQGHRFKINNIYLMKDCFIIDYAPYISIDSRNRYDYRFFDDVKLTYASGNKAYADMEAMNVKIEDDRYCALFSYGYSIFDRYNYITSLQINGVNFVPEDYYCEEIGIRDTGMAKLYGAPSEVNLTKREMEIVNVSMTDYGFSFQVVPDDDTIEPIDAYVGSGLEFDEAIAEGALVCFLGTNEKSSCEIEVATMTLAPLGDYFARVFFSDGTYADANFMLYADSESRLFAYTETAGIDDGHGHPIIVKRIDATLNSLTVTYIPEDGDVSRISEQNNLTDVELVFKSGETTRDLIPYGYSINEDGTRTDMYSINRSSVKYPKLSDFAGVNVVGEYISFGNK